MKIKAISLKGIADKMETAWANDRPINATDDELYRIMLIASCELSARLPVYAVDEGELPSDAMKQATTRLVLRRAIEAAKLDV